MVGSVPDAQQSGSILSQFGFIRRGDVELALRRMGATIAIPRIYPTEIASNYRGKSSIRCGYSLTTEFLAKAAELPAEQATEQTQTRVASHAACQFLAVVSQLAPEINTEPKSEDAKERAYNRGFDWGHRRHEKFSLSFDCTQRGPKWKSNSARGCGIRGYVIKPSVKRYGPYLRGYVLYAAFMGRRLVLPRIYMQLGA
jgi:hypothetical protein